MALGLEIRTAVHIVALCSFTWSFHYISQNPIEPLTQAYGGHSQYLTVWGLAISAVSCTLGLLEDLSLATASMKTLHAHVSFVAGGLETLLTFVYWSIVWYDESFVRRQRRLPGKVLDISLHLNPLVFLMADIFLKPKAGRRPTEKSILCLAYLLSFSYGLWQEHCRLKNEFFPYPIMEKMSLTQRGLGYAMLGVVVGMLGCALVRQRGK